jgi:hypothetical protein
MTGLNGTEISQKVLDVVTTVIRLRSSYEQNNSVMYQLLLPSIYLNYDCHIPHNPLFSHKVHTKQFEVVAPNGAVSLEDIVTA